MTNLLLLVTAFLTVFQFYTFYTIEELKSSIKIDEVKNEIKLVQDKLKVDSFGSLAPLPGPTTEGTTTAGWTDDGSIVRLNTSSDNVGIGTNNPSAKLQVQGNAYVTGNLDISGGTFGFSNGNATATFSVINNGNVGLGTTTPRDKFSVVGGIQSTATNTVSSIYIASSTPKIQIANNVFFLPTADGSDGQALTTDGNRNLSFNSISLSTTQNLTANGTTTGGTIYATSTLKVGGGQFHIATSSLSTNGGMATTSELIADGAGGVSWGIPYAMGATTTNKGFVGTLAYPHGLGRIPRLLEITLFTAVDDGAGVDESVSGFGYATSTQLTSQFARSMTRGDTGMRVNGQGNAIIFVNNVAATEKIAVNLSNLDSTNFTLNWTTNTTNTADLNRFIIWKVQ